MKMTQCVLLALTLSTLLTTEGAQAKAMAVSKSKLNIKSMMDVYDGVKFQYFDLEDRLLILNDFLKTVELEYALLPLKAKRIGLDFTKMKADAIANENASESIRITAIDRANPEARDSVGFLQAKSNMDFLDRMHALVAQFQDTHFSLEEKISRPFVYTGIRLYRIRGKIIIGSIENKFMGMVSKLSGADLSRIAIGDEIISINGQPVEDRINELKKYISGSSDEFIDSQAVRALTIRNFKYDTSNSITFEFKNAGIFKLPLFANKPINATNRLDAQTFFKKYEIPLDTTTIGMIFDKSSKQWLDSNIAFEGYSPNKLQLNLKELKEYLGDDGTPVLRSGYYINKGKIYGVLQILSFNTVNVKNGDKTMSFINGVRQFVAELKEAQLPLILDLRNNGGGNGNLPSQVLSVLSEKDTIYAGATSGFRMTAYMRQVQEPSLYRDVIGEDQSFGVTIDIMKDIFRKTLDEKRDYTPMFASDVIPFDEQGVKGFENHIVALVTANCISACDKMSFLLKSSGRAVIIGTHSNGTGAGFLSSDELNTKWEDRLRLFETQVPNYLFGIPGDKIETTVFEENSVEAMCSENKPTMADIPYSPSLLDVSKNNIGWLQIASAALDILQK